jgi:hypothetical protein
MVPNAVTRVTRHQPCAVEWDFICVVSAAQSCCVAGALEGEKMNMMTVTLLVVMFMLSTVHLMKCQCSMKDMQRQYGKQQSFGMFGYCVL